MTDRLDELSFSPEIYRQTKRQWDKVAKPIDSLGLLEDCVCRINAVKGDADYRGRIKNALVIFCADHGVVAEGVTQTDSSVTKIVSDNFAAGKSTVNIMAAASGTDVYTVDAGMDCGQYDTVELMTGCVIDRKIRRGTSNLRVEAAMSEEECERALKYGSEIARQLKVKGYDILSTGEMGIGNTTPTSVLTALLLDKSAQEVAGRGAGLSDQGLEIKTRVIADAIGRIKAGTGEKFSEESGSNPALVKEYLRQGGGFEIAMMAGLFLGGAEHGIPVVIDGVISAVAALSAMRIDGRVQGILIPSHVSAEGAGSLLLEEIGLPAIIHGRMCLGEGTGAMALIPLINMAYDVYRSMGTFEEYEIEQYERFEE